MEHEALRRGEPETQAVGSTVTWQLLEAGEAASGYTVRNLRLTAFPGSGHGCRRHGERDDTPGSTGATSAELTATQPGMAVITYEAVKDGTVTLRRIPILLE